MQYLATIYIYTYIHAIILIMFVLVNIYYCTYLFTRSLTSFPQGNRLTTHQPEENIWSKGT